MDGHRDQAAPSAVALGLQAVGVAVVALGGLELLRRRFGPASVTDEAARVLERAADELRRRGDRG